MVGKTCNLPNNSNEVRVDIRTQDFWEWGQQAFFDLSVFDPNTCRYRNKSLQQCHAMNEQEKKQAYNERILQIDHGSFKPLVFSINCSMGRECQKFYSHLAQMISERETFRSRFKVIGFKQKFALGLLCFEQIFALLKSSLFYLSGSRTVYRKTSEFEIDVDVSHAVTKI